MADIVLAGNTSGTLTLSAPDVAGTTTLNLPASSGTVLDDASVGVCRAWVNFNGTGTVAIRAGFNVSSITDNGTGYYTVNFTNVMPDANYAWGYGANNSDDSFAVPANATIFKTTTALQTASSLRVMTTLNNAASAGAADISLATVSVFR